MLVDPTWTHAGMMIPIAVAIAALGLIVGSLGQPIANEESFESDKVAFLEDSYALMCMAAGAHPADSVEAIASCVTCEQDVEGTLVERNPAYIRCLQNIDPAALSKCQALVKKLSAAEDLLQAWIDFVKCANNFVYEKFVNLCVAAMTGTGSDREDFKQIANCVHDQYQNATAALASAVPSATEERAKASEDEDAGRAQALMAFQAGASCHFSHSNDSKAEAGCNECFAAAAQAAAKTDAVSRCIAEQLGQEYRGCAHLTDANPEACIGGVLFEHGLDMAVKEANGVVAGSSPANKYLNAVNHVYSQMTSYVQEKAPANIKGYLTAMLELQEPFES